MLPGRAAEVTGQPLRRAAEAVGHDDPLHVALPYMGRRGGASRGEPAESKLVLYTDSKAEIGIWEVTPGIFPAAKVDCCELMHFISGSGRIVDDHGTTEIRPGVVMFTPDGWSGTWIVDETIRKTYALYQTRSRAGHVLRTLGRRARSRLGIVSGQTVARDALADAARGELGSQHET